MSSGIPLEAVDTQDADWDEEGARGSGSLEGPGIPSGAVGSSEEAMGDEEGAGDDGSAEVRSEDDACSRDVL